MGGEAKNRGGRMSLMTREEMIERVEEGENPLELSIEKWKRVEAVYLNRSLDEDEFCAETCALCHGSADDCHDCPFFLTHGHPCDARQEDGSYYWQMAAEDIVGMKNRGHVRRMVEALEKIRGKTEKIE